MIAAGDASMLRIWPATIGLFLVFATIVLADQPLTWDSEFENTLYNTPKGWSTTQQSGVMTLIPPDLKLGEQAGIIITPGAKLTGQFADAFTQLRADVRGNVKATQSEPQSATADEGYPVLYVTEQILNPKGKPKEYRFYLGSNPDTRIELVMLVASPEEAYNRYVPVFQEFIKTLAYKSARPGAHATSGPATAPSAP
jgi:hypothetical protein